MIWLVRIALKRPYTFVVLALLIMIFGPIAALRAPTDIFPDIKIPVISAVWTYNGLSPEDMSGRVVYYYERQLSSTVNDIEHIESTSLPGYGIVKIFFQPNVDIRTATAQVTSISQTVLKQMPPGITPPLVLNYNASTVPILQIALSSPTVPEQRLFDYGQNFIRPQLATVAGSSIPSPYGGKVRQIQIDLNPQALLSKHLSAQDVQNALNEQTQIIPVGTQKIGNFEYSLRLNNSPNAIEELNNIPIKVIGNTVILIRDVANVRDGSPPQTNVVRVDGGKAVLMTVLKSGAASTLDIVQGAKNLIPKIAESIPPEVKIDLLGDQSIFVKAAVSGVAKEAVLAAVLTSFMILLFLGSWRSTVIIAVSIPLAILSSITLLYALGESLNIMTLGGLALAVGILVDDATVTIENINWHLEQGKTVRKAIMDGAHQIVTPAFVSLLCICIVFIPMFMLSGVARYLFVPMAEAVVFAMIASFFLSRTLVPTMAAYLLKPHASEGHPSSHLAETMRAEHKSVVKSKNPLVTFQHKFEHYFSMIRRSYYSVLTLVMQHRKRFVWGYTVFVLGTFCLVPLLGRDFFPPVDSGQIKIHVRAQVGTRIEETAKLFDQVEGRIREIIPKEELASVVDNIGLTVSGINTVYSNTGTIGPQDGDILITLSEDHKPTEPLLHQLRVHLSTEFPGVTFAFLPADIISQILNFGSPAPIDVQVMGPNKEANTQYANLLMKDLIKIGGLADVRIQQANNYPMLSIEVDRSRAKKVGITERDVTNSLVTNMAGSGQVAPSYWLNRANGVSYPIVAQTPDYRFNALSDLENLAIDSIATASTKDSQILGGLATIKRSTTPAVISHYAVQPVIDIYATPERRDLGSVANDIEKVISAHADSRPKGATISIRGQVQTMNIAFSGLLYGLLAAIVLIYFHIVVNFQSWSDPFVIVSALPAALAGIIWMLFATHTTLSVPALTGAIMCMGVATANSILVVSFARERILYSKKSVRAALEAGFTRFRPVLMTALAMIIGMAPMALGLGEGGEQNAPLGRAVIGGLIMATLATLLFVPVLFSMIHENYVEPVEYEDVDE
jgi:multidrug efflux pump subunit AcrB